MVINLILRSVFKVLDLKASLTLATLQFDLQTKNKKKRKTQAELP